MRPYLCPLRPRRLDGPHDPRLGRHAFRGVGRSPATLPRRAFWQWTTTDAPTKKRVGLKKDGGSLRPFAHWNVETSTQEALQCRTDRCFSIG
jgi:hypothetical protein